MNTLFDDVRRMIFRALCHTVVIISVFGLLLHERLFLVNLMKLPHEAGALPDIPWYYKVVWCIDPQNHPTQWTGDPFCFAIDVRVVFFVLIATICINEAIWKYCKKRCKK